MLYLIGLGLNLDGISKYGLEVVKRCKKVYLENYTIHFPYSIASLSEVLEKKIVPLDREQVEGLEFLDEAKKMEVALLVYGSPFTATTHISIIDEAKKSDIKYKIIYNASVIDAVAETGLQLYKFGKIASMPQWDVEKHFTPDSFMEVVKDNQKIDAHSLILVDIGLNFKDALRELKESAKIHKISLDKLIICQALGTPHAKILYRDLEELEGFSGVKKPFCMILPGKLHFVEKEFLEDI
jgi:diphthine synthase